MGTRATYTFVDKRLHGLKRPVHVYIHWDGYPDGAAMYFYNALCFDRSKGLLERFIAANEHAEFTDDPARHGDTEFHYELEFQERGFPAQLLAYQYHDTPHGRAKSCISSCSLYDFIHAHHSMIVDYSPFVTVTVRGMSKLFNKVTAMYRLEGEHGVARHLRAWFPKFVGGCNWNMMVEELNAHLAAFPDLSTDEYRSWIAAVATA